MKSISSIVFILFSISTYSQNLVINYSFEDTISCVNNMDASDPATSPPWFRPTGGSSDYFTNYNFACWFNDIPSNTFGFQFAKTGNSYVGIVIWQTPPYYNVREYLEGILVDTLKSMHAYCVQFYVSPGEKCKYFTDDIGAYLTVDSVYDLTTSLFLPFTPQISNAQGNMLNDTLNWMLVSGSFIAQGGENYITIGNFKDDIHTTLDTIPGGINNTCYYYIDDVSVTDCTVGINEAPELKFTIGPNPVKENLYMSFENYRPVASSLKITNIAGQVIWKKNYSPIQKPREIDVSGLAGGVYFITLQNEKGSWVKKFVKQ